MSINTACPHCERAYTLGDALEGKSVRCKACEKSFLVSATEEADEAAEAPEEDERPRRKPGREKASPVPAEKGAEKKRSPEGRDRRRKGKRGTPLWPWLVGGGVLLLLLLGGGVVAVFFFMGNQGGVPLWNAGSVAEENFQKLDKDMSQREVVSILGSPTKEFDKHPTIGQGPGAPEVVDKWIHHAFWEKEGSYRVEAVFDDDKLLVASGSIGKSQVLMNNGVLVINGVQLRPEKPPPPPGYIDAPADHSMVQAGMTEQQIIANIGPPLEVTTQNGNRSLTWIKKNQKIGVVFINGKASGVGFSGGQ